MTAAEITVRAAGQHAVLVEFSNAAPRAGGNAADYYAEALRRRDGGELPNGLEIVPAARTILFDGFAGPEEQARFARELRRWRPRPHDQGPTRDREIPTRYDGPDLPEVARAWGLTVAEVIARHAALPHVVGFLGFAPGFAYIDGIPESLAVSRRAEPRTRVPTGSVAIADRYTGVYPRASPGGWQLIGRTDVTIWDVTREPAAYLLPGDRVRFVPVRG
jgi:KipI family sensor histidine kinase inhibitor